MEEANSESKAVAGHPAGCRCVNCAGWGGFYHKFSLLRLLVSVLVLLLVFLLGFALGNMSGFGSHHGYGRFYRSGFRAMHPSRGWYGSMMGPGAATSTPGQGATTTPQQ